MTIGVRADFLGWGLNQFCPKNPGQSGNFSGRKNAKLPEKNHFARGAAAPQPPGSYAFGYDVKAFHIL